MKTMLIRSALVAAMVVATCQLAQAEELKKINVTDAVRVASNVQIDNYTMGAETGGLFQNYYASGAGSETAGLYLAPHPVPYRVGHVFYTYEPLMPHEMLYTHNRTYYSYHQAPGGYYPGAYGRYGCNEGQSYTKTTVTWQNGSRHFSTLPASLYPLQNLRAFGQKIKGRFCGGGCNTCR